MAKPRSPILGFNTNVIYKGREYHVQTEDSGVESPHIFTHLFHGGVILATKREDYDASEDELAVKRRMQDLHKNMLRELKRGTLDERIVKYLGSQTLDVADRPAAAPITPEPAEIEMTVEPSDDLDDAPTPPPSRPPPLPPEPAAMAAARRGSREVPAARHAPAREVPSAGGRWGVGERPAAPSSRPAVAAGRVMTPLQAHSQLPGAGGVAPGRLPPPPHGVNRVPATGTPAVPPGRAVPATPSGRSSAVSRPPARPFGTPTADGVVVARPSVVVGGSRPGRAGTPLPRPVAKPAAEVVSDAPNLFGATQERSLDEVILAYLKDDKE